MLDHNLSDPRDARDRADGRSTVRDASPFGGKTRPHPMPSGNVQLQIWSDKLPEIIAKRRQLQSTVPNLHLKLIARFLQLPSRTATEPSSSPRHYQDCARPRSRRSKLDCPARVAELRSGKLRTLKELLRFSGFGASRRSGLRRFDEQKHPIHDRADLQSGIVSRSPPKSFMAARPAASALRST